MPEGVTFSLLLIAGVTLLALPAETFNAALVAHERMASYSLPRVLVALLWGTAAFFLVRFDAGLSSFVILRAGEAVFLALVAWGAFFFHAAGMLRISAKLMLPMMRQGLPLMLASFAMLIYMRIDQVMLGQMREMSELGRYAIAARVSELSSPLPSILQATFYASIVRAHGRSPVQLDGFMQRLYDSCSLSSWVAIFGIGLAAGLLFVPIFGESYAAGLPVLLILLIALPFSYLNIAWGTMLAVRGWLWAAPAVGGLGAILNVLLNFALIPGLGGTGAAIATVCSICFAGFGASFLVPRLRPAAFGMLRSLWPFGAARRLWHLWRE